MSMASIETMGSVKDAPEKKLVNLNLISLKCLLFLFFGGMGCLFPFLPLHMVKVGLTLEETRLVSMISPVIAIIGPLIVAPVADKLASCQGSKPSTGRYLRVMIAIVSFLSAVFYSLLLLVPIVERIELPKELRPTLKFACDRNGATIFQERNNEFSTCYNWTSDSRVCGILLRNCRYECPPTVPIRQSARNRVVNLPERRPDIDFEGSGDLSVKPLDLTNDEVEWRKKDRHNAPKHRRFVSAEKAPPHLCFDNGKERVCHVYTNASRSLSIQASFQVASNARERGDWCAYPIAESHCRIPNDLEIRYNGSCTVECDLLDPSMLQVNIDTENQCSQVAGDPEMTFWMYITIRSLADIFPTAGVALIDAAMVIATRETSCGRGDVGRQLAFGSLGFATFGSLSGYLNTLTSPRPPYLLPIVLHVVLMVLTAVVSLSSSGMPLSPPEWWWHTRSGMLAVPMSAVKRYGSETAALVLVMMILGTFWSAMDSYLPLHLSNLQADALTVGVVLTVGAVPAIVFLWRSEHLVDYCGHSNLLIIAFTMYIVRFTGLSLVNHPWWALAAEAFELFTLGIMWITAILYLRHLIPRHLTVTAQALPVVAHFCVGRCLGAVIAAYIDFGETDVESIKLVYQCMAIAAAIVAVVYFIVYHGVLKPRCHAQNVQGSRNTPSVVQGMNGNGRYTPLRVYHNGMGKKGQFRY
ncbi:uncharacterized protein SP1173 [Fopius arisanus]|uniref:Uncharacterized protein SP1173 n=2 Tax=Fopius arisanus TaxID=64838 RepID=A0A9R1SV43_9HYME|nr:PREDICTED: uncharacterized protein LOC105263286 [Fopius arisanus]XP_011297699.1 PREDICTED: uncharacterized protein LOC105263286 [Fopius arisanus]